MEVLMAQKNRSTVNLPLIAALGLTMAVGFGIYVQNTHPLHLAPEAKVPLKAIEPAATDIKPAPIGAGNSGAALGPVATLAQPHAGLSTPPSSGSPTTAPAPVIRIAPPARPASAAAQSQIIADATGKFNAGDLLSARVLLNDALVDGHLTGASADSARKMLGQLGQTVILSKTRYKDDPFQTLYQVQSGDRLARIADRHSVTWELLCRINGMSDPRKMRSGQWLKIPSGPFHCVITKSVFRMDVYLGSPGEPGSLLVASFPVGLGKDNSTPTGSW